MLIDLRSKSIRGAWCGVEEYYEPCLHGREGVLLFIYGAQPSTEKRIRSRARLKWKYMRRDLTKTVESFRYINLSYEECYHDEVMDKKHMRK